MDAFGTTLGRLRHHIWAPSAPHLGTLGATFGRLQHHIWEHPAPIWRTAAFGGGERSQTAKFGAPGASYLERQLTPPLTAIKNKEKLGCLRRPKYFYKLDPFHEDKSISELEPVYFHNNSKNKNRKMDFSFVSAHCASSSKLRGVGSAYP